MPHITEQIYQYIPSAKDALMVQKYPVYDEKLNFEAEGEQMELVFDAIRALRNVRASFNIPVSSKINILILGDKKLFGDAVIYLQKLAKVEEINFINNDNDIPKQSASAIVRNIKIAVPLKGLIDIEEEIKRQNKKIEKLQAELNPINGRLNNEKFVSSAPEEVVLKTKEKQKELADEIEAINEVIQSLK